MKAGAHLNRFAWSTLAVAALVMVPTAFGQRPEPKRPKVQRPIAPSHRASSSTSDSADAKLAADFTKVLHAESSMLVATLEGSEKLFKIGVATPTLAQVAANIVAHASARYVPAGCVLATQSQLTVRLIFNGCTGPRGLRKVTGALDEVVSMGAAGTIDINATATQLQIGQTAVSMNSNSVYSVSGATRSMAVTRVGIGTGPLGRDFSRNSNYTTTWTSTCVNIDGAWQTSSDASSRSRFTSVTRCNGGCPTGTITRERGGLGGRTTTITFDGTPKAKWTTSNGKSGFTNLTCGY